MIACWNYWERGAWAPRDLSSVHGGTDMLDADACLKEMTLGEIFLPNRLCSSPRSRLLIPAIQTPGAKALLTDGSK